jgi:hypothetical protein
MLAGNERLQCQWFKDAFVDGVFKHDFDFLYKPHGSAGGSSLVFYPHGSLFCSAPHLVKGS